MRKSFWVPITLALAAYLVLPLPGATAPLSKRIDQKRAQLDQTEAQGGRAHHHDPELLEPHRGAKGEISATADAARTGAAEPRPPEERAARGARPPRGRARPPRAAAQRAGHGPQGAGGPARGDLQGGRPRRAHGDPRGRRLRRPARARRVPGPHLGPGPRDHRRGEGLRDRAEDQADELASLERREQLAAERILRERDQIASVQEQLVSSREPARLRAHRPARRARPGTGEQGRARGRPGRARGRAGAGGLGAPGRRRRQHLRRARSSRAAAS